MGRLTPSITTLAPSQRRDARAKRAKVTLNKDIPALLVAYPRAKRGVEGSVLVVDPPVFGSIEGRDDGENDGEALGRNGGKAKKQLRDRDDGRKRVDEAKLSGKQGSRRKGKVRTQGVEGDADLYVTRETGSATMGQKHSSPITKSTARRLSRLSFESDEDDPGSAPINIAGSEANRSDNTQSAAAPTSVKPSATAANEHSHPRPRIRICMTDTLSAAQSLKQSLSQPNSMKSHSQPPRICILNMCSPLRPGGGFLSGATSQEESLCMRTTLYPSLREEFYRLPEVGGVYTKDILVFRESDGESESGVRDLEKNARWWVDVVSAGMLRFPEVENISLANDEEEDSDREAAEEVVSKYVSGKDRELVEDKMRGVMRIVKSQERGVKGLILGAWGCGAYGNPVSETAGCWRRVLLGDGGERDIVGGLGKGRNGRGGKSVKESENLEKERQSWSNLEIVFAIKERKLAIQFANWFGEDVEIEIDDDDQEVGEEESVEDGSDASVAELQGKIRELEAQIVKSKSEVQKDMLRKMLTTLRKGQDDDE